MQHGGDNDKGAESSGPLTRRGLKKTPSVTIIKKVCGKERLLLTKNTAEMK
jgi:hypothetical protein